MSKKGNQYTNKKDVYIGKYEHIFNKNWTENEIKSLADELIDWMEKSPDNLWVNKFFTEKKISRSRIHETFIKNSYFNEIYELCKSIQEYRMFDKAQDRKVNPAIFILGLKNNHNWKDKPEVEKDDNKDEDLTFEGW